MSNPDQPFAQPSQWQGQDSEPQPLTASQPLSQAAHPQQTQFSAQPPYLQQPLRQPQPPPQPTPPHLRRPEQPWPQQPWEPPSPTPKRSNGLAITALVVALLALALALVLGVVVAVAMAGFFSAQSDPSGDLQGTAPGVVAGQPYPGESLADEVARVIEGDGGGVTSMTCPATATVRADAVSVCHGVVDGYDSQVRVTFDDNVGHFTLVEDDGSGNVPPAAGPVADA